LIKFHIADFGTPLWAHAVRTAFRSKQSIIVGPMLPGIELRRFEGQSVLAVTPRP
jgi:hypothetical protein